ncbi:hypothetical protein [Vibrio sp. 10N.239.312.D08]|uniref:hypothetical protein n=1 Tax=Vibrio sp. 10N.239.312.D08 TaxID=3229978 RepID=UPI00354DFEBC
MKTELLRLNQNSDEYTAIQVIRHNEIKNININNVRVFDQTSEQDFILDGFTETTSQTAVKGASIVLINNEFVMTLPALFVVLGITEREVNTEHLISAILNLNA